MTAIGAIIPFLILILLIATVFYVEHKSDKKYDKILEKYIEDIQSFQSANKSFTKDLPQEVLFGKSSQSENTLRPYHLDVNIPLDVDRLIIHRNGKIIASAKIDSPDTP